MAPTVIPPSIGNLPLVPLLLYTIHLVLYTLVCLLFYNNVMHLFAHISHVSLLLFLSYVPRSCLSHHTLTWCCTHLFFFVPMYTLDDSLNPLKSGAAAISQ